MKFLSESLNRSLDIMLSIIGIAALSPIFILTTFSIWLQDFKSPFYVSNRVGKNELVFRIVKLRTMVVNADAAGIDSTSVTDPRITRIGRILRRYKIDELSQLFNVFLGNMSFVGPRPNVQRETEIYTRLERKLLTVKPGITDLASIVFSDEGEILANKSDPDISYNQLIRPGKSELGLFYIENKSIPLDIAIIALTVISIFSRDLALKMTSKLLHFLGASEKLIKLASRKMDLVPSPPPGSNQIVKSRFYKENLE